MASLSQALRLGDLPPPHRTFQGHATHIIEWSMMLRPNDSWSTCILQGIATFLHYASRRSAGYRYTTLPSAIVMLYINNTPMHSKCQYTIALFKAQMYYFMQEVSTMQPLTCGERLVLIRKRHKMTQRQLA